MDEPLDDADLGKLSSARRGRTIIEVLQDDEVILEALHRAARFAERRWAWAQQEAIAREAEEREWAEKQRAKRAAREKASESGPPESA